MRLEVFQLHAWESVDGCEALDHGSPYAGLRDLNSSVAAQDEEVLRAGPFVWNRHRGDLVNCGQMRARLHRLYGRRRVAKYGFYILHRTLPPT